MEKTIAREILVATALAAMAAALLLLARFAGIPFNTQTYPWSLGILYGVRILVWALRTVRGNQKGNTLQQR